MVPNYFLLFVYLMAIVLLLQQGCAFSSPVVYNNNNINPWTTVTSSLSPRTNHVDNIRRRLTTSKHPIVLTHHDRDNIHRSISLSIITSMTATASSITTSTTTAKKSIPFTEIIAKFAGYLIGLGAMTVYAPIMIKILRAGNADGYAISTWVYNLFGLTAASVYPLKKGFPISTYIELLSLSIQSALMLGVICYYQGYLIPFLLFMSVFVGILSGFLKYESSPNVLAALQVVAILACNYANIPQIILNYQTKVASWDIITAILSVGGNFTRILTTLYFTKDRLILSGYSLGFITNSILLGQILYYK